MTVREQPPRTLDYAGPPRKSVRTAWAQLLGLYGTALAVAVAGWLIWSAVRGD